MKTYILLGILLLAGLSFAKMAPNWMMYAVNGYGCNYDYNSQGGWHAPGLYSIVANYDNLSSCHYWSCNTMANDLDAMYWAVWDDGSYTQMCSYSGCYGSSYMSTTDFRSSILGYNVAAADYKSHFLAGLRAYLAENPGDKSDILSDLQGTMADYRACLAAAAGYGSCWMCY